MTQPWEAPQPFDADTRILAPRTWYFLRTIPGARTEVRARLAAYPKLLQELKLPPEEQAEIFEGNIRKLMNI